MTARDVMSGTQVEVAGRSLLLLAWAVVLFAALSMLAVIAVAVLPLFGYESRVIMSGSMEPALPVGSVIVSRSVPADSLEKSDIVTSRGGGGRAEVTHRIVDVAGDKGERAFTLKGDANAAPDPQAIIFHGSVSRMELAVPYLGYVISFVRRPWGPVVLLLVPAVSLGVIGRLSKGDDGPKPLPQA